MSAITIEFRDGTIKHIPEQSRPGGSWTNSVRYEGNFVIVKDVWDAVTAYPVDLVAKVTTNESRW
jgi:hypothetical protein